METNKRRKQQKNDNHNHHHHHTIENCIEFNQFGFQFPLFLCLQHQKQMKTLGKQ